MAMTFWVNFAMLTLFIGSTLMILTNTNWRNHLILLFCVCLYFIYLFVTPTYYASINDYAKHSNDFQSYFEEGMWIYFFSFFFFLLGYFLFYISYQNQDNRLVSSSIELRIDFNRMDFLFYSIIVLNLIFLSFKFSLENIFSLQSEDNYVNQEDNLSGWYNYLMFFSDSLISVLIGALLLKVKKGKLIFWVSISFFIFLILGFRYRILLTLVGFIAIYFFQNKVEIKKIIYYSILLLIVTYTILFITNNRANFSSLNYSEISFEWEIKKEENRFILNSDKVPLLFGQTNNFSTDFSVLKAFQLDVAQHDYGESMIYHIFVRLIPSNFFEDGVKPAIPQQVILRECFGSDAGREAGAAVTNIFEYYIAFGEVGAYFLMFIFGGSIAFFSKSLNLNDDISIFKYIIITALCFQIITRGFTPQVINHLVYMLIPYFIIKKWIYQRKSISSNK